uniref:NADH-ubiquinone oxidoreductase chain 5 n=1 Tax=Pimelocerus perforatus TaxID=1585529 RepID=A0A7S6PW83_9CUCU|nr:NADH dehydrogenase subunit 5 [Pimelocerus perforatus]QOU11169.1 NADH dehydrogenase subunit 5 [Pimelocerus perforatus]
MLSCNLQFLIFMFFSNSLYLLGLYFLNFNMEIYIEYEILSLNSSSIVFIILLDWVSLVFMSFVFFISSLVIKYSDEYMYGDKKLKRFIWLMVLFVFSMMLMILSPNLVSILLGWDGLGLVSFGLVNYYQNIKSYNASMLTALTNRIGDAAILMGVAFLMNYSGWTFSSYLEIMKTEQFLIMVSLFVIMAAMTKSAQIPFSSWLPAAMAAPTPVSSLVHSSTLVTAGVYLLIRFSYLFSHNMFYFLLLVSLTTMYAASIAANLEYDLKKIIALSTLSQLGMMITILSLGEVDLVFFHLLIHAFFKALLFMCAGAIIHNLGNCQDIRYMGGVIYFMPLTCVCFNISNFALCGLPFLSGFYSKDLIAEFLSGDSSGFSIYLLFYISVGLTVSYSMRVSYFVNLKEVNYISLMYLSDNNNKIMLKGMVGLVYLVIVKGSMLMWLLFSTPPFLLLPSLMKLMTLSMIGMGAYFGYELSCMKHTYSNKSMKFYKLSSFLVNLWNMPILSTFGLNSYFLRLSKMYNKKFDYGWLEYYGSKNLFKLIKKFSKLFQLFMRNHLKLFFLVVFIWILVILVFF